MASNGIQKYHNCESEQGETLGLGSCFVWRTVTNAFIGNVKL